MGFPYESLRSDFEARKLKRVVSCKFVIIKSRPCVQVKPYPTSLFFIFIISKLCCFCSLKSLFTLTIFPNSLHTVNCTEDRHDSSNLLTWNTALLRAAKPNGPTFRRSRPLGIILPSEMARVGGITNAVNVGIAVQADWENREFVSHISLNVRRLFDFLVQFGIDLISLSDPSFIRYIARPNLLFGCLIFIFRVHDEEQIGKIEREAGHVGAAPGITRSTSQQCNG